MNVKMSIETKEREKNNKTGIKVATATHIYTDTHTIYVFPKNVLPILYKCIK